MTLRHDGRPIKLPDYTASHPTEQRYHHENLTSYKICAEYQECIKSPIILASDITEQTLWFGKNREENVEKKEKENKTRLNKGGGSIWGKVAQYISGREDRETEKRNRKSIGRKKTKEVNEETTKFEAKKKRTNTARISTEETNNNPPPFPLSIMSTWTGEPNTSCSILLRHAALFRHLPD